MISECSVRFDRIYIELDDEIISTISTDFEGKFAVFIFYSNLNSQKRRFVFQNINLNIVQIFFKNINKNFEICFY